MRSGWAGLALAGLAACVPRAEVVADDVIESAPAGAQRGLLVDEGLCEASSTFETPRAQVLADLDVVERVLREGWAGFEPREKEGVDWKAELQALRAAVAELPDPVPSDLLRKVLAKQLSAARDNHLSFWRIDTQGVRFQSSAGGHLDAWTTDVPPAGEALVPVLRAGPLRVEPRAVRLSRTKPSEAWRPLQVGGAVKGPAFARDGATLTLRTLDLAAGKALEQFVASGAELATAPWVVLDVRGNQGGGDTAALAFVKRFIAGPIDYPLVERLESDVTAQGALNVATCEAARPDLERETRLDFERERDRVAKLLETRERGRRQVTQHNPQRGEAARPYAGAFVLLVDRKCSSSCESLVAAVRQIPNAVVLGENTGGVGVFGEALIYRLPNSGVWMRAGSKWFHSAQSRLQLEEGRGHLPDLWLDEAEALPRARELAACLAEKNCPESIRAALKQ